jgi:polar amino acid transport system permease protein
LLFIPNWGTSLLITIKASNGASLVGVSEIVGRCNNIISAMQNTDLMVPLYLYASLYFLVVCYPLTYALQRLRAAILLRVGCHRNSQGAHSGGDPRPS